MHCGWEKDKVFKVFASFEGFVFRFGVFVFESEGFVLINLSLNDFLSESHLSYRMA